MIYTTGDKELSNILVMFILVQVDKVAAGLLALGLKRGERLGVWGPNTYEWILFQFASAKAGIILVSLEVHVIWCLTLKLHLQWYWLDR